MDAAQFQTFITMLAAVVGIYIYWKRGGNAASEAANASLKLLADSQEMQIADLNKRVTICEGLHRENLVERGRTQAMLAEKDKRIEILEHVRVDPETLKVLHYIGAVAKTAEPFMQSLRENDKKVLMTLEQISVFMQNLNNHFALNNHKN